MDVNGSYSSVESLYILRTIKKYRKYLYFNMLKYTKSFVNQEQNTIFVAELAI